MDRIEILEKLAEPFATLSDEERALALSLAQTDPEVRQALRLSQMLAGSHAAMVMPAPKSSDAAFVVAVRNRISLRNAVGYKGAFVTGRRLALVASACVIVLVAVIVGGRNQTPTSVTNAVPAPVAEVQTPTTANDDAASVSVDSLVSAGVDPLELAAYLNVTDVAEQVIDTTDGDSVPLTDELLALDAKTLEEVLSNLNETSFF